jgi:hypothetical protein
MRRRSDDDLRVRDRRDVQGRTAPSQVTVKPVRNPAPEIRTSTALSVGPLLGATEVTVRPAGNLVGPAGESLQPSGMAADAVSPAAIERARMLLDIWRKIRTAKRRISRDF